MFLKRVESCLFAVAIAITAFGTSSFLFQSETSKKIEFINSLKQYAQDHLELDFKKSFYSEWTKDEGLNYYLYVSEPDAVDLPSGSSDFMFFGTEKELVLKKQKELIDQGFHTLIYTREGPHDYTLTNSLLSFSNESIAFIIFHDATHQHFNKHGKLSLKLEEATCEVMGSFGAKFYASKNNQLESKAVKKMNRLLEKTYEQINKSVELIGENESKNEIIYRRFENRMFNDYNKSDAFIKERFIHPVNNAYLLKNQYYSKYYELVKQVAIKDKYISTFLHTMEHLPRNEEKAVEALRKHLSKNE